MRSIQIAAAVTVVVLLGSLGIQAAEKSPPNVVLILVDDLGWADVGCFGSEFYETPHIDGLAAEGMRFTHAYAACAVCSPTRAAVLTGRYPARTGVTDWIRARFQGGAIPADKKPPSGFVGSGEVLCPKNALWLNSEEITLAEKLKEAGYTSCHIGKWHLGPDDWYPEKQGFDFNFGGCDYGQPPSYFDPYKNGKLPGIPNLEPRKEGEFLTDREGDEAAKFISDHKDKPFFLYLANYAVHTPIMAKPEVAKRYDAKERTTGQKNAKYAALVESVDDAVGKVLGALSEAGVAENTLVIFTSDNGGLRGVTDNTPLRSGKGYPYEGGVRVPLIVKWPGVTKAGSVSEAPVTSVDYFPTVCGAAGLNLKAGHVIDGVDLSGLLGGFGDFAERSLFWHFPHYRGRDIPPYSMVRAGKFKLIKRYAGEKAFELFNVVDDVSESEDLAGSMPEKVEELNKLIEEWCEKTEAKMPVPNRGKQK